jgi:hypothetical protein
MTREERVVGLEVLAYEKISEHPKGGPENKMARGFLWLLKEYKGQQRTNLGLQGKLADAMMRLSWQEEVEEEEVVQ